MNRKERLFTCEICNASYSHKTRLSYHKNHDCGRLHTCNQCGKMYSQISNLKRHLRKDHDA